MYYSIYMTKGQHADSLTVRNENYFLTSLRLWDDPGIICLSLQNRNSLYSKSLLGLHCISLPIITKLSIALGLRCDIKRRERYQTQLLSKYSVPRCFQRPLHLACWLPALVSIEIRYSIVYFGDLSTCDWLPTLVPAKDKFVGYILLHIFL